jgi:glycosidase
MPGLLARCRDNARTPMQWDSSKNGGFSSANSTWIKVNPNYTQINVAEEEKDSDSILNYYKKMIQLRKDTPALVYGSYTEVDQNNPDVFAYKRELDRKSYLIVCNFKNKTTSLTISPDEIRDKKILINNYTKPPQTTKSGITLEPYQTVVIDVNNF